MSVTGTRRQPSDYNQNNMVTKPTLTCLQSLLHCLQNSNWNILRNLIEENDFLRKYKERRPWRQVAGHKDSFIEGQNEVQHTPNTNLDDCHMEIKTIIIKHNSDVFYCLRGQY